MGFNIKPNVGSASSPEKNTNVRHLPDELDQASKITFNIFKANGGVVVSTEKIDNSKDDYSRKRRLYIITDDMNLGEELSKIVTLEGLRS